MSILQSTQFDIQKLRITTRSGEYGYDVREIFEELNLFDSMLMPCMSGNIVIRDATGFASKINFDGSEYIEVDLIKDLHNPESMFFRKRFVIYKLTDRKEMNQKSEIYTLHFVSEEFILSEQKKIRQSYKGTYSEMVMRILEDHLKVPFETIVDGSRNGTGNIAGTTGIKTFVVPNLSPLETIDHITKKALSVNNTPDFFFWENYIGYNFMPLSTLLSYDSFYRITVGAKNLPEVLGGEDIGYQVYGARDLKILSQFDMAKNIQDGVYAGKFIGFDPLTRTVKVNEISFDDVYGSSSQHANPNANNTKVYNKEGNEITRMYDSRVTLYAFQNSRRTNEYLKQNDSKTVNYIDDTENYVLQRKIILSNLMQRRIRITLPGNFALTSGNNADVEIPKRYNEGDDMYMDETLSGKYIILSVRHIIRYDKHETIIEAATDSTMKMTT